MKMQIFRSYNVLGHEKRPVYTEGGAKSEIYDRITVEIPDEVEVTKRKDGVYVMLKGKPETFCPIYCALTNFGDDPVLNFVYPGDHEKAIRRISLKILHDPFAEQMSKIFRKK